MSKPYDIAVTFGRFNLFHKGHLDLLRKMDTIANRVAVGMSGTDKNLPGHRRQEVMKKVAKWSDIDLNIINAGNPFEVFEAVGGINMDNKIVTVFGEDQVALAKAAQKAFGWSYELIPRRTSSTALRGFVDNEEWDLLAEQVPGCVISHIIKLRQLELCPDSN